MSTPDNNVIELIEYVVPKGKTIDLSTCNTGVAHLGFVVDDIQQAYKELTRRGVNFTHTAVLGYIKGPDGITVEFLGPLKQAV